MEQHSEAETRALDSRCRLPTSPASRTAVVKLRALPPASQAFCIAHYAQFDLPHLVRCAVEAVRSSDLHAPAGTLDALTPVGALNGQGVSADTRWGEQDAPVLCIAAEHGSERALKALQDGRANHALANKKGITAAHKAAYYGHTACLRLLIDAGAQLEAKADAEFTPLHLAAQKGHAECCSLPFCNGRRRQRTHDLWRRHGAVDNQAECVRVLLPASDLSVSTNQGRNAFHNCILWGKLECFGLFLPLISDVDVRTVAGVMPDGSPMPCFNMTPLHLACSFGQERMVKALLHRGASRTARDSSQRVPLHEAALCGHLGCVGRPRPYSTPFELCNIDLHTVSLLRPKITHCRWCAAVNSCSITYLTSTV